MNCRRRSAVAVCLLIVLLPFAEVVSAIRCKCSNSKGAAPCRDGVCAVGGDGERFGACVALNHSVTGMHYACTHRNDQEQTCTSKVTNSGSTVTACFCSAVDFCNGLNWPPPRTIETRIVNRDDHQVVSGAASQLHCTFLHGVVLLTVLMRSI